MTKEEFYAKWLELLLQSIDARDAIIQCAKQHGTWKMGLDSNRALFKTLEKTYRGTSPHRGYLAGIREVEIDEGCD